MIRKKLYQYKTGELSLQEVQDYTQGKYADGASVLENLLNAYRISNRRIIASSESNTQEIKIQNYYNLKSEKTKLKILADEKIGIISSPIYEKDLLLGYDIVSLDLSSLLSYFNQGDINYELVPATTNKIEEDQDMVKAFRKIADTDYSLKAEISKKDLYQTLNNYSFLLLVTTTILSLGVIIVIFRFVIDNTYHDIINELEEKNQQINQELEYHQKYEKLFSNINSGVIVYEVINEGEDFNIIDINKAGAQIDNINKEQILGKSIQAVFPKIRDTALFKTLKKVYQTGNPVKVPVSEYKDNKIDVYKENYIYKLSTNEIVNVYRDVTNRMRRKEELKKTNHKLKTQLEKGRKIHQKLLPDRTFEFDEIRLASFYSSAEKIGADFYQVIELDDKVIFYISDTTGHSLDGAFLNLVLRELIKNFFTHRHHSRENISLGALMDYINQQYRLEDLPDDYFISLILFVIDKESNMVKYINAGLHINPILVKDGEITQLNAGGPPISDAIASKFYDLEEEEFELSKNSTLLITTDGLIEEESKEEMYGKQRLSKITEENYHLPPEILLNKIVEDVRDFSQNDELKRDDITLLAATNKRIIDELSIIISSSFSKLDKVRERISHFLDPYYDEVNKLLIGIQEMAINAIEHGNAEKYDAEVEFRVCILEDSIVVEVIDEGQGFAWEREVKKELALINGQERGRGVAIANKSFDYLSYNQTGNRAILYERR